jgi:excisionase family DNA binding protein
METYLTIAELAAALKLAAQTIRRYVLNREIPYHQIRKVIRFKPSEIERWIESGGLDSSANRGGNGGNLPSACGGHYGGRGNGEGNRGGEGMTDMDKAIEEAKAAEREAAGLVTPNGGKSEPKQGEINFTRSLTGFDYRSRFGGKGWTYGLQVF